MKRGQGILEAAAAMLVLALLFAFVFMSVWILTANQYLEHSLHGALLCLAQGRPRSACEQELFEKSRFVLASDKIKKLRLRGRGEKFSGVLIWEVRPWEFSLKRDFEIPKDLL